MDNPNAGEVKNSGVKSPKRVDVFELKIILENASFDLHFLVFYTIFTKVLKKERGFLKRMMNSPFLPDFSKRIIRTLEK